MLKSDILSPKIVHSTRESNSTSLLTRIATMGNSSTSRCHSNCNHGDTCYCSICKKVIPNEPEVGCILIQSTNHILNDEISACTNTKEKHKFHTRCLLEQIDRCPEKRTCPICHESINNGSGSIIKRFGIRIPLLYPEVALRTHDALDKQNDKIYEVGRQNLATKIQAFRESVPIFQTEIRAYELISGPSDQVGDVLILYLEQMKGYLESVPDYLQNTKEYQEGIKLYQEGIWEYYAALEGLRSRKR